MKDCGRILSKIPTAIHQNKSKWRATLLMANHQGVNHAQHHQKSKPNAAVPKMQAQLSATTTDFSDMSEVSFVEGS